MTDVQPIELVGWRYDLRSHILFSSEEYGGGPPETWDHFQSRYRHEVGHWVRFQTSSIGLLLHLISRAKALTAVRALRRFTPADRHSLIGDATANSLLWLHPSVRPPSGLGSDFDLQGQFWLDLDATALLILDDCVPDGAEGTEGEAIGSAMSDAWREAEPFGLFPPHPGNEIADSPPVGHIDLVHHNCMPITTRTLWECASTLDELSRADAGSWPDASAEILRMANVKLRDPRYGAPWQYLSDALGGSAPPRLALLAIHIATNPELPFSEPYVPWSIAELHPPSRFFRLCRILREDHHFASVDQLDLRNDEVLAQLRDDLLDACGMTEERVAPAMVSVGGPIRVGNDRAVGIADLPDLSTHPSVYLPFTGDLNALIRLGIATRAAFFEIPTLYVAPRLSQVYSRLGPAADFEKAIRIQALTQPPLMEFAGSMYSSRALSKEEQTRYLAAALLRNTLEAVMTGRTIDQSYLPREARIDDPRSCLLAALDAAESPSALVDE